MAPTTLALAPLSEVSVLCASGSSNVAVVLWWRVLNVVLNGDVLRSKEKSLPAPDGGPEETPNSSLSSYPVGERTFH